MNLRRSNDNQPEVEKKPIPESSREWFQLIEPSIKVDPEEASGDTLCRLAQKHAKQVVERTELDIDVDDIEWKASRRLRACHGQARSGEIKLSLKSFKRNGWCKLMNTVRHELIHIWQYQHLDSAGHGESFERWMDILNVSKKGGQVLPIWELECTECGRRFMTHTDKTEDEISRIVRRNEQYHCNDCKECTAITIRRDGEVVSIKDLPEVPAPTTADKHIFLYNTAREDSPLEWDPEVANLMNFPGIGNHTVASIGPDIHTIDDMLSDGTLDPDIRNQIPTRHTELEAKLAELAETAFEQRSNDDLDLLERARNDDPRKWWWPMFTVGGKRKIPEMRERLRTKIEPGVQCELQLRDYESTYRGTITKDDLFTRIRLDQELPGFAREAMIDSGGVDALPALIFHNPENQPRRVKIIEFEVVDTVE